ncbi:MAG: helix-turn-helix domain-containing protein [Rhizobium sp.]|nr:helix-turn-helix domain-containing protein [Rhizobium sp.]
MEKSALEELGFRIRTRRKQLGWTQEVLAANAGLDRSYVGGIERGERNITFTVLCDIARSLRWDVARLTVDLPETAK